MSYYFIKASEISDYVYCRRSWQIQRDGHRPADMRRYIAGTEYHREHHTQVRNSKRLGKIALLLLFVAIGVATFWIVWST